MPRDTPKKQYAGQPGETGILETQMKQVDLWLDGRPLKFTVAHLVLRTESKTRIDIAVRPDGIAASIVTNGDVEESCQLSFDELKTLIMR